MKREVFSKLVERALDNLPEEFIDRLDNVEVTVEDFPTPEQLHGDDKFGLLGLYEGVPLTERGRGYNLVMPDRITLFQKPIEAICRSDEDIVREVGSTVRHEIAHFFGISDERLDELDAERDGSRYNEKE